MSHTKGEWIAFQKDLGLGPRGEIIITTQEEVRANQKPIARDIDGEDNALRICLCHNTHDKLLAACEAWMLVDSESISNTPSPDLALRALYRKKALALTKTAIAEAKGNKAAQGKKDDSGASTPL